jgi:hypothetical protein
LPDNISRSFIRVPSVVLKQVEMHCASTAEQQ